ncbi:hypothetical protein [Fodinicola feengrottensis]|uniref:hypothetical protein n=1 Tax=Fodinicola feengrottensis TaxID=435914 RepID=UPI0013D28F5C|nr:hypothetical protein [Fodinicola feengrottensis]
MGLDYKKPTKSSEGSYFNAKEHDGSLVVFTNIQEPHTDTSGNFGPKQAVVADFADLTKDGEIQKGVVVKGAILNGLLDEDGGKFSDTVAGRIKVIKSRSSAPPAAF